MKDHGKPSTKVKPLGVAGDSLHFRIICFFYQYRTSIRSHSVSVSSGKWRLRKRALSLSPSVETFFIVRVIIPYSRPYINTHLLPNVLPSDQLWLIILTTDQLYLQRSTIPITDRQFLARIIGRIEKQEFGIRNPESGIWKQNPATEK